ncbi:MAG: hypothetical protein IRY92_03905 [Dactylosporangium sp.]|nr:hypothetical protein [Dactylosporangium sp.]
MRVKDWPTPPTPPRLTADEAAAIERGETTWEDVVRQHEARAILRRLRPPLPEPEPLVTEFGRSVTDENEPDMALLGMVIILVSWAFTVAVLYLIGRYLP